MLPALRTYLPQDRGQALAGGAALPDPTTGAVLFADISGFTPLTEALTEALGPRRGIEELTDQINAAYDALIAQVDSYRGSVISFAGDAITCWFDDRDGPVAARAVACAQAIQRAMAAFRVIPLSAGGATALDLTVAVASSPARRFAVGDPDIQIPDVLAGATLARMASAIDQAAGVYYLTLEELRKLASALPGGNRRSLISARKAEVAHFRAITPALGTEPAESPADDPLDGAMGKFLGVPPQPATELGVVRGNAGSSGIARGPARVIRTLVEAARLQRGDVLMTTAILPPWTPLFVTAAAVVTDVDGILSHCAVVAREYGIPAVVGTGVATTVIQDGHMLR
jgi:phosphohistidine swiveling domain-containing protein